MGIEPRMTITIVGFVSLAFLAISVHPQGIARDDYEDEMVASPPEDYPISDEGFPDSLPSVFKSGKFGSASNIQSRWGASKFPFPDDKNFPGKGLGLGTGHSTEDEDESSFPGKGRLPGSRRFSPGSEEVESRFFNFDTDVLWSSGSKTAKGKGSKTPSKPASKIVYKGGCLEKPAPPPNSQIRCSQHSGCEVSCLDDYQFPNGQTKLYVRCEEGTWKVTGSQWDRIPHCEPICMPACQNQGFCIQPNQCNCPDNFEGPQCQYPKAQPCYDRPPTPKNSRVQCNAKECIATCNVGYKFPSGEKRVTMQCQSGTWVPAVKQMTQIPDCEPICDPACENGGRCLSFNVCECPQDFRGPRCQYPLENCSPDKLSFNGGYNCSGDGQVFSCTLSCEPDGYFESPPASRYTCDYSAALFLPEDIPQCIFPSDRLYRYDGKSSMESFYAKGGSAKGFKFGRTEYSGWEEKYFEDFSSGSSSQHFSVFRETLPKPGRCLSWGGAHYKTFDGIIYSFRSGCSYTMVRDVAAGTFSVVYRVDSKCSGSDCRRSINIYIEDDAYIIAARDDGQPTVQRGETSLIVPGIVEGMLFERVGEYIVVQADGLGFSLKWDTKNNLMVDVSEALWNRTAGLCGKINGHRMDDFENPDGSKSPSLLAFVNNWEADNLNEKCQETPTELHPCKWDSKDSQTLSSQATAHCDRILSDPRFESCRQVVDPRPYYESCRWDYCQCGVDGAACACSAMETYFRECLRVGGSLEKGWRDSSFCPMNCTSGKVYMMCGPVSEDTCDAATEYRKADFCVEGCYCPEGTALHKGECIPRSECPCMRHGVAFKTGDQIPNDCNTCTCMGGEWKCTEVRCGSRCAARGDPHYTTFDGRHYDFMGKCTYYLVKAENFTIEGENVACAGAISENLNFPVSAASGFPSCTKTVTIRMDGDVIKLKQNREVVVNGEEITHLPLWIDGTYIRMASSVFLAVELPNGVEIWWDGLSRVYIDAPPILYGKTQGLCGTFNENQRDDLTTPEGDIEQSVPAFANKWKTKEFCSDVSMLEPSHPCEVNAHNRATAEKHCGKLKSRIFEGCHNTVDVEQYYKDCLYDVCACQTKVSDCLCPALASYVRECTLKGVVMDWIPDIRECGVHCTGGQIYQVCGNSCTRTCYDISTNPKCRRKCVEGCNCPEGQTLDSNGQCIPIHQCTCIYKNVEYRPGYMELRPGSRSPELCTCVNARWSCRPATPEEQNQMSSTSSPLTQCKATNNEEFTDCEPDTPVTCKNMHGPTPAKPAVCKPGCRCKKGYVLDAESKRCVKASECPCHHGGHSYSEGEKITEDCNTCTCNSGKWECTKLVCPGICSNWGESHFKTFDGRMFDFHGNCDYMLAKGTSTEASEKFQVSIQNVPCGSSGIACSKSVTLRLGGAENEETVTLTRHKKVQTGKISERILVREAGLFVYVEVADLGLVLQWDFGTRVYLRLDPKWKGRVRGLCGNYNDDQNDDFQSPSGGLAEVAPKVFGDSWRLQKYCPESVESIDTCTLHPHRKVWSIKQCSVLKSELFQKCHSEVPVDPFVERCVVDSCGCDMGGDCECLCTALAAYAHECNLRGVAIKWRSQELCPIQCNDECSHYTPCMNTCQPPSCDNPDGPSALCNEDACIEGCQPKPCPAGQVHRTAKDMTCVPLATCPSAVCAVFDGVSYAEGETIEKDACHSCFCSKGKKICQGKPCPPTPTRPGIPTASSTTTEATVTATTMRRRGSTVTPPTLATSTCQTGWSEWMNTHTPKRGTDSYDIERIPQQYQPGLLTAPACDIENMVDIQCRTVGTHIPHKKTGDNVQCSLETGLECEVGGIRGRNICFDYEMRILCDCGNRTVTSTTRKLLISTPSGMVSTTTTTTTEAPTTEATTEPTFTEPPLIEMPETQPPFAETTTTETPLEETTAPPPSTTPFEFEAIDESTGEPEADNHMMHKVLPITCHDGWTDWMNDQQPSLAGEYELTTFLRKKHSFCAGHQIVDVQCRRANDADKSGLEHVDAAQCNKDGYRCRSRFENECEDHEVRFKCECRCQAGLGLELGTIDDTQITASSFKTPETDAAYGRLYGKSAWSAEGRKVPLEWLQIDLKDIKEVTGVDIQGHPVQDEWVTTFAVQHSPDRSEWETIVDPNTKDTLHFTGNSDSSTVQRALFPEPIFARYVRVVPSGFRRGISMRLELLGCSITEVSTTTTEATTITELTVPTTEPSPRAAIPCSQSGWTEWMNSHVPSPLDWDDHETVGSLRMLHDFCPDESITQIDCRVSGSKKTAPAGGQRGISCDLNTGLSCRSSLQSPHKCFDYEVRFFCQCHETVPDRCDPARPNSPHPTDCYKFYQCVDRLEGTEQVEKACLPPTMYNPITMVCDWPAAVVAIRPECGLSPVKSTPATSTTPTEPVETVTPPCSESWTDWFNVSSPVSNGGDFETYEAIAAKYPVCPKSYIRDVECKYYSKEGKGRVVMKDYTESPDKQVKCKPTVGFVCYNDNQDSKRCQDYTVRFLCGCEPVVTTTRPPKPRPSKKTPTPGTVTTPAPTTVPSEADTCPEGSEWSNCAYRCDQACVLFKSVLYQRGYCQGDEGCAPGCVDVNKPCPRGYYWRDDQTCVAIYDCTCRSHTGEAVAPGAVLKESDCEVCQCVDNYYVCDTSSCTETVTPSHFTSRYPLPITEKTAGPTTTPAVCSVWSPWFNEDEPDEAGDQEFKSPAELRALGFCVDGVITDIECRDALTDRSLSDVDDNDVVCNLKKGLSCLNSRQGKGGRCKDYKIRYYCECGTPRLLEITTPSPEETPSTTTIMIMPPTTPSPIKRCSESHMISLLNDPSVVPDSSFSASSSLNSLLGPQNGRLSQRTPASWTAGVDDTNQYIQVDLGREHNIFGVDLTGSPMSNEYVTSFFVTYSDNGQSFSYVVDSSGKPQLFHGPLKHSAKSRSIFHFPVEARYVRLEPQTWKHAIALQFDLLGCKELEDLVQKTTTSTQRPSSSTTKAPTTSKPRPTIRSTTTTTTPAPPTPSPLDICSDQMGLENGALADEQYRFSSTLPGKDRPRLGAEGSWRPKLNSRTEYLRVDFLEPRNISGVVTQGDPQGTAWVESYKVRYSRDGDDWFSILDSDGEERIFPANVDGNTPKTNQFDRLVNARYIEIVPVQWHEAIALRTDILGCYHPYPAVPTTTTPEPSTLPPPPELPPLCHPCPNVPQDRLDGCGCPEGKLWDGAECVLASQCPCYVGNFRYEVGSSHQGENCASCLCKIGGVVECHEKKCPPCGEDLHSVKTGPPQCACSCRPCDAGTRLCKSSNACINETLWCNGVEDCPDDELDCTTPAAPPTPTEVTTTTTTRTTTTATTTQRTTTTTTTKAPVKCPAAVCPDGTVPQASIGIKSSTGCPLITCIPVKCEIPVCPPGFFVKYQDEDYADADYQQSNYQQKSQQHIVQQQNQKSQKLQLDDDDAEHIKCPEYTCLPIPKTTTTTTTTTSTSTTTPAPALEPVREDICSVDGRVFDTFDGVQYNYDICNHILARDAADNNWRVTIHKNCTTLNGCRRSLRIVHDDHHLAFLPGLKVEYNNFTYSLSQAEKIASRFSEFTINRVGESIFFRSNRYGFWVTWDNQMNVKIGVTSKLVTTVDGLCGYYSEDPEDDKRTPAGKVTTTQEFGDSWSVDDGTNPAECETLVCTTETQKAAWEACNKIKEEPFKNCYDNTEQLNKALARCVEMICSCALSSQEESDSNQCKCEALTVLSVECHVFHPSVDLTGWRTEHDCPVVCENGAIYKECNRRRCEITCDNRKYVDACPEMPDLCFPGCVCPDGLVRKGDACVKPNECRDCVCDGFGDPQYLSFDRTNYTFNGNCTYVAARDQIPEGSDPSEHDFQVLVTNKECEMEPGTTCTDSVTILFQGHEVKLQRSEPLKSVIVTINGEIQEKFPVMLPWIRLEKLPGEQVTLLLLAIQVEVSYYFHNYAFSVRVPSQLYFNKTEGLCGNCNGDPGDDMCKPNGDITPDSDEFGLSWLVKKLLEKDEEDFCQVLPEKECIPLPPEEDPCLRLVNHEIFHECHAVVDPLPYITACQYDVCHSVDHESSSCNSLEAYARECAKNNVCLPWRSPTVCPIDCPAGMEYRQCGSGCLDTCESIAAQEQDDCLMSVNDGCYCPDGQAVSANGTCVPTALCTPCDDQGHYVGDQWSEDACTKCTCTEDKRITCNTIKCVVDSCPFDHDQKIIDPVEGVCCPTVTCVPKAASQECPPEVIPECGKHQRVKALHVNSCVLYSCECIPEEECPILNTPASLPGDRYTLNSTGCCPHYDHSCAEEECPPKPECPAFYELEVSVTSEEIRCCPFHQCVPPKNKCVYVHDYRVSDGFQAEVPADERATQVYPAHSTWKDGLCRQCECKQSEEPYSVPFAACTRTECPDVSEEADGKDYVIESHEVANQCCPKLVRTACKEGSSTYQIGETWASPDGDPCKTFECEKLLDGTLSKQPHVQKCNVTCSLGWEYKPSTEECCGSCVQVACVFDGVVHNVGDQWVIDPCTTASCVQNKGSFQIETVKEDCTEPSEEDKRKFAYETSHSKGQCCPVFKKVGCLVDDIVYKPGDKLPSSNPCEHIYCAELPSGDVDVQKNFEQCSDQNCKEGFTYEQPQADTCCGSCVQTHCVYNDRQLSPGESVKQDACTTVTCEGASGSLQVRESVIDCIVPNCPDEDLTQPEGACCPVCESNSTIPTAPHMNCAPEVLPASQTVGLIVHDSVLHGRCVNKEPIAGFQECAGQCKSGTTHLHGSVDPASNCQCCQAVHTKEISVPLTCPDGRTWTQTVHVPTSCECQACVSGGDVTLSTTKKPATRLNKSDKLTEAQDWMQETQQSVELPQQQVNQDDDESKSLKLNRGDQ